MDCWIASFPRSGNTYFRNILYYVYGIESSTWHRESAYPVDENYEQYRFVKTHLLPEDLVPVDRNIPAIYLVRDGRDAVVSIAHHRKDLVEPGSDYLENLKEAIVAAEGSYFGGWSVNAEAWLRRADIVIRYEDLVKDPQKVFERVEGLIELPEADWSRLPEFRSMKSGKPKYGGSTKLIDPKFNKEKFAEKFFRRGSPGSWKDEMPDDIHDLFWSYHGPMMEKLGYDSPLGSVPQNTILDLMAMKLMGVELPESVKQKHVVIEATKLTQPDNDGIKRYLVHLLQGFEAVRNTGDRNWNFELLIGKKFLPLESYRGMLRLEPDELHDYEKVLMGVKRLIRSLLPDIIYEKFARLYRGTDIRKHLKVLQKKRSITKELEFTRELEERTRETDLLHLPLPQNSEYLGSLSHRFVVTVHDLTHESHPEFHEQQNIFMAKQGMQFIADRGASVIAVSENTIQDLIQFTGTDKQNIHLVYESADPFLFRWNINKDLEDKVREKYNIGDKPYLLCLSTIEPRKNLPNTIRAFTRFRDAHPEEDVNLVIAGNFGWKTEHLESELKLNRNDILFTGYVDDQHLNVLYSGALALCYISFYEGFGLPPLEAMSCRTPVIYGNNSSMPEVVGDAGLAADPGDVEQICEQMKRLCLDSELREQLAGKAIKRSFRFSWRKSIKETLEVYEKLTNDNHITGSAQ